MTVKADVDISESKSYYCGVSLSRINQRNRNIKDKMKYVSWFTNGVPKAGFVCQRALVVHFPLEDELWCGDF